MIEYGGMAIPKVTEWLYNTGIPNSCKSIPVEWYQNKRILRDNLVKPKPGSLSWEDMRIALSLFPDPNQYRYFDEVYAQIAALSTADLHRIFRRTGT